MKAHIIAALLIQLLNLNIVETSNKSNVRNYYLESEVCFRKRIRTLRLQSLSSRLNSLLSITSPSPHAKIALLIFVFNRQGNKLGHNEDDCLKLQL